MSLLWLFSYIHNIANQPQKIKTTVPTSLLMGYVQLWTSQLMLLMTMPNHYLTYKVAFRRQ